MAKIDDIKKIFFCLLLLLITPSISRCQSVYEYDDHDTSIVGFRFAVDHSPELYIKKGVLPGTYVIKYFGSQKIRFTCNFDGTKYVGLYTEWYENGVLKYMVFYNNSGAKHGNEFSWYDNGNAHRSNSYHEGKLVNSSYKWDKKSQLIKKTTYVNNEATEYYYKNGKEIQRQKE